MIPQRIPPYSEEAEKGLLGCILLDSLKSLEVCMDAHMKPEWFYLPAHRTIAEHMLTLNSSGRVVDIITIPERLSSHSQLDAVGGFGYIDHIIDATPTATHVSYYLEIVRTKYELRQVIDAARSAEQEAYQPDADPNEVRSKAEYALANLDTTTQNRTASEILDAQCGMWEDARERGCVGVESGFEIIDKYFGGLIDGALYYLSGLPGSGKTTLARNVVENLAMNNIPVYFWSLEQTAEQIWGSIAARHAQQSVFLLNQGSERTNLTKLRESKKIVQNWPIHIDDQGQSPSTLWTSARKAVGKLGCRLLVLDYLQALRDDGSSDSDVIRQTNFSNCVRDIAKTLKVPVLVISALSNSGNLRGSGMLAYDAWGHIKLEQADDFTDTGRVVVNFEKQRFGPLVHNEYIYLIGSEQRFSEYGDDLK